MNKTFILAAAFIALSSPALAQFKSSTSCQTLPGIGTTCRSSASWGRSDDPKKISKEELEAEDFAHAKWVAFCKPVIKADEYGVGRYTYAHKGCEFGRSE